MLTCVVKALRDVERLGKCYMNTVHLPPRSLVDCAYSVILTAEAKLRINQGHPHSNTVD